MENNQNLANSAVQSKKRSHRREKVIESFKGKMDKQRTSMERYADKITTLAGSNIFLFLNVAWFAVWILWNTGIFPVKAFDPFPFGFLTMVVSLEAIILAILVLISQNRSAKIADIREEIQLQINIVSEEEITKIMEMLVSLCEHNGISMKSDSELQSMLNPTNPEKIEKAVSEQLNGA